MPMFCAGDQPGGCGGVCWAGAAAGAACARADPAAATKRTTKAKAVRVAASSRAAVKWFHFLAFFMVVSVVRRAGRRRPQLFEREVITPSADRVQVYPVFESGELSTLTGCRAIAGSRRSLLPREARRGD